MARSRKSLALLATVVVVSVGCESEEARARRVAALESQRQAELERQRADSIATLEAELAESADELRSSLSADTFGASRVVSALRSMRYAKADTVPYGPLMDSARAALRSYQLPLLRRYRAIVPELPAFARHYERYDGDYYNHRFGGQRLTVLMRNALEELKQASWGVDVWGTEEEIRYWRQLGEMADYYVNAKFISGNVTREADQQAANIAAAQQLARMKAEFERNMRTSERIRAEKARRTPAQHDSVRREIRCLAGVQTNCD